MRSISFVKRIAKQWVAHDNSRSAAAIGFYAIFTLAPMLVLATTGLGQFVGHQEAQSLTEERLAETMGPSGARIAHEVLANADFSHHSTLATVISGILLLYGASAIFYQLRKTLDRIFGRPTRSPRQAMIDTILGRLIAAVCVILATSLLVAALVAQVVLSSLSAELQTRLEISESFWQLVSTGTTVAVVFLAAFALLKFLPSQPPGWRDALLGVMVSVVLFEIGKWLIGMYISRNVIASAYGPSSTVVAFILWIYYTAQIFILGAEVAQIAADVRENRQPPLAS